MASSSPKLRADLGALLQQEGITVREAQDGLEAFRAVFESHPDLIVVDLAIDAVGGVELVRMLRAASDLAIVALQTSGDASRGVAALEQGADDVVRPNTAPSEFLARVRAAVRRAERSRVIAIPTENSVVRTGALTIDRYSRRVLKSGSPVHLSATEYRLLSALAARVGQVAPHRYLLSTVWGDEYVDDTHYLRVYIGYLRAKLEDNPAQPQYLRSEWGVGYRLAVVPVENGTTEPGQVSEPVSKKRRRRAGLRLVDRQQTES